MSTTTLEDHARLRLRRVLWHARHNARTAREAHEITLLWEAVRAGHVNVRDAHDALAELRRDQQTTERADKAA